MVADLRKRYEKVQSFIIFFFNQNTAKTVHITSLSKLRHNKRIKYYMQIEIKSAVEIIVA